MLHVLLNVVVGFVPVVSCFTVAKPTDFHCEEVIYDDSNFIKRYLLNYWLIPCMYWANAYYNR